MEQQHIITENIEYLESPEPIKYKRKDKNKTSRTQKIAKPRVAFETEPIITQKKSQLNLPADYEIVVEDYDYTDFSFVTNSNNYDKNHIKENLNTISKQSDDLYIFMKNKYNLTYTDFQSEFENMSQSTDNLTELGRTLKDREILKLTNKRETLKIDTHRRTNTEDTLIVYQLKNKILKDEKFTCKCKDLVTVEQLLKKRRNFKGFTRKDLEALNEVDKLRVDNRNFCEYLKDMLIHEHQLISLLFLKSLMYPLELRISHLQFLINYK